MPPPHARPPRRSRPGTTATRHHADGHVSRSSDVTAWKKVVTAYKKVRASLAPDIDLPANTEVPCPIRRRKRV